ncbi:transposase [Nonomuraea sp. B19D2]|uniref:transposase n=1 Tax=Nonomuraea sp. B19D2 TaxID=3159561 RepID=UPI0032DBBDEB
MGMARGDLMDEEWALIEPHLPLGGRGQIPDLRQQFNAAMWRFRTGSPWRDLPAEYGSWSTAYDRFRIWASAGVFQQLMQAAIGEAAARGRISTRSSRSRTSTMGTWTGASHWRSSWWPGTSDGALAYRKRSAGRPVGRRPVVPARVLRLRLVGPPLPPVPRACARVSLPKLRSLGLNFHEIGHPG